MILPTRLILMMIKSCENIFEDNSRGFITKRRQSQPTFVMQTCNIFNPSTQQIVRKTITQLFSLLRSWSTFAHVTYFI